jgi:hypothetical protein
MQQISPQKVAIANGVMNDGVAVSTAESGSVFVSAARMEIPWLLGWSVVGFLKYYA